MTFAYFRNHQDKPYTIKGGKMVGKRWGKDKKKGGGKVANKGGKNWV